MNLRPLALCSILFSALALASSEPAPPPPRYADVIAGIDARRRALAARLERATSARTRAAIVTSARAVAFRAVTDEILPAWYGTPWAFYGTSETPREGTIACGYLVTTVLRDAGLKVERVPLAQKASEKIVKTLAPESAIQRFRNAEPKSVLDAVHANGDGLYVVGMDYHVGLLVLDGERADLCHSAVLPPASATCEPAAESPGFQSSYYVVGPVFSDARVRDWLEGREIATVR